MIPDARAPAWVTTPLGIVVRCTAVGIENVPRESGVILVANHRSMADAAAIYMTCPGRLAGPAKAELFPVPVFGRVLRWVGAFPVHRDGMDHRAARSLVDAYRAGRAVLVFPEGHRNQDPELLPFSPNVARLAIKLQAPVIPVGIAGTEHVLQPGHRFPRRSRVVVVYGKPLDLSEFYNRPLSPDDSARAAARMRDRVGTMTERATSERLRILLVSGSGSR